MRPLLLAAALTLQGCQLTVDGFEFIEAAKFCESKGGVDYLSVGTITNTYVRCANGEHELIKR